MYESTRRARERIVAMEILKLERRQALVRSQPRARASTLAQTPQPGAFPAGPRKGADLALDRYATTPEPIARPRAAGGL